MLCSTDIPRTRIDLTFLPPEGGRGTGETRGFGALSDAIKSKRRLLPVHNRVNQVENEGTARKPAIIPFKSHTKL